MRNKTSSNKTIIIILFVILFLIVAAIVVIVFYLRGNGEKEINKQLAKYTIKQHLTNILLQKTPESCMLIMNYSL